MCGITGYVGSRPAEQLLLSGLERLEYRGYDSAGIALLAEHGLDKVRTVGNLAALRRAMARDTTRSAASAATMGIGHTRWATHGRVEVRNAHPHGDHHGRVEVVLNGIVENFVSLRKRLQSDGYSFSSDTDAEAVAQLISACYEDDLAAAVQAACREIDGHFAFVVMSAAEPDKLVAARRECPLVIGRGEGEQFLASDIPAFLGETRFVQYVENDELVVVRRDGVTFLAGDGSECEREIKEIDWDPETAEKAGFDTFMLKEIHEQPQAVARTVLDRIVSRSVSLDDLGEIDESVLAGARRVVLIGCGTSYHAGLVGRYAIEEWARVPTELDIASEYRYRNPVVSADDLVIGISQSGETADTLAALRLARSRGGRVLGVTNVMGSQITRETDGVLYTRAGIEIGVAATKTYVAQVAAMYLLALKLGELHGTMPALQRRELLSQLEEMPRLIDELVDSCDEPVRAIAERYHRADFFLYLGRHVGV
ncbi:MAG: glutamine--fructose-6-phosphate transaminase (isomerizing), partial [Thermoleophilaceae bacterium]